MVKNKKQLPVEYEDIARTGNVSFVETSEVRAEDLEERLSKVESLIDKHYSEQRNYFMGALLAAVFVIVAVVAQLMIYNASYKDGVDELQKQQFENYQTLQHTIDRNKDTLHEEILDSMEIATPKQNPSL